MITDLTTMGRAPARADVVVIGSGPCGIALALDLEEKGHSVVMIESGPSKGDSSKELKRFESSGECHRGLAEQGRALGGSSLYWAGQCMRFTPLDLATRSWVPNSGWPLSLDDLEPHYQAAERFFEVEPQDYGPAVWRRFGLGDAPTHHEAQVVNSIYCRRPDLQKRFRKRLARSQRITVVSGATAIGLEGVGARVTGVRVAGAGSEPCTVVGDQIVLAGGAIQNARLLLLAKRSSPQLTIDPAGLAGQYFQDHLQGVVATATLAADARLQDYFSLFYERGTRFLPKLALSPELQAAQAITNAAVIPVYNYSASSAVANLKKTAALVSGRQHDEAPGKIVLDLFRHLPQHLRFVGRRLRGRSNNDRPESVDLHVFLEQVPRADSAVSLAEDSLDSFGLPVADIKWVYGDQEMRTAAQALRIGAETFADLGLDLISLKEVPPDELRFMDNNHHMGTTRMSAVPEAGVVDVDCRVWGSENLFCAGGSVFPTSSYVNPTLTMVAMTLRLSDHLAAGRR